MKLILIISLILSSITQYPLQVIAQTEKPTNNQQPVQPARTSPSPQKPPSRPVFVPPKPPSGLTRISGRRAGMGSRNNCPAVSIPLTALVPFQEQENLGSKTGQSSIGIVEGQTTSERPKFWFYVPYTQQDLANSNAEFSLQDSEGMDVHRETIALPPKPGVIGISLPNTVKPLEERKTYHWYFKVHCDQQTEGVVPVYVNGDIHRISLKARVTEQLKTAADLQEEIVIYAKEGIWFDALNRLAQIRQSSSQDASVQEDWKSLLQSVDLDNIATAPFVN